MAATFPTSLDVFTTIPSGTKQGAAVGSRVHREFHNDQGDAIEALEAKLGVGSSVAANLAVLVGTGAGTSSWLTTGLTTGHLAANAVTQTGLATGSASSPTTTSTSYVDLNDMSVTLTTVGGDLLVWFSSSAFNSAASNQVVMALSLDGAAEVAIRQINQPVADYAMVISTVHRFSSVAAGSHTVKARWKVNAGTGTAYLTYRSLLVEEVKK